MMMEEKIKKLIKKYTKLISKYSKKSGGLNHGLFLGYVIIENDLKLLLQEKCDHESDGAVYTSYPSMLKCKKCGEFYRDKQEEDPATAHIAYELGLADGKK